jgi:exopolysaccharide biosynthesis operon protein EpsL
MKPARALPHVLTLEVLCLLSLAARAQEVMPTQPSVPAQPSRSSVPSTPSLPSAPSQPAGIPYPDASFRPGTAFEPAGTQEVAGVSRDLPEPLKLRAVAGLERDSNVLRSRSQPIAETAAILGVGLRAERQLGLQRLRADVEANRYHYGDSALNYQVLNYALAWEWSLTPRLHGVLAADRKQYREVVTNPATLANDVGLRTDRTELLEAIYEAGARLRLLANVSHDQSRGAAQPSWDGSPEVHSARVGIGYETPARGTLYARFRRGDGRYTDGSPGVARGSFREDEPDVVLDWPLTGKTSLALRLGHLARRHDEMPQGDFSGAVGSATLAWQATGKTRLVAGANRQLGATGDDGGGHVRTDRVFIGPVWQPDTRFTVNVRFDHARRAWKDVPAADPDAGRSESLRVISAGLEWQPRRWLAVSGYVRRERQRSSLNGGYGNNTVGVVVKTSL